MTGPEHYREAERLLTKMPRSELPREDIAMIQREAQVHATLFAAAATLATEAVKTGQLSLAEYGEWLEAVGIKQAA